MSTSVRFGLVACLSLVVGAACRPGHRDEKGSTTMEDREGTTTTTGARVGEGTMPTTATPETQPLGTQPLGTTAAPRVGSGPFEGIVEMRVESEKLKEAQPVRLEIDVPEDKIRFELPASENLAQPLAGILDPKKKNVTVISDQARTMAKVDLSKVGVAGLGEHPSAKVEKNWRAQATDRTDQVAGVECRVWELTKVKSSERAEVCLASGLPQVDLTEFLPTSWVPMRWESALENAAMPLRVTYMDASGKRAFFAEVTNIQSKAIDNARLQPPPGYTEVKVPAATVRGLPNIPGLPKP